MLAKDKVFPFCKENPSLCCIRTDYSSLRPIHENFVGDLFQIHTDTFQYDLGVDFYRAEVARTSLPEQAFGRTETLFETFAKYMTKTSA